jgi:2-polyprenyl-3-methyl-5-hydroxy-6-metoxy-1,4-benzoquinol methylase
MEDAANQIVDHYERHALSWDADRRAAGWIDKPFIERFLGLLPRGASVLDLGCGGGSPVALHMVTQGFRVTGVDSSPPYSRYAEPGCRIRSGSSAICDR